MVNIKALSLCYIKIVFVVYDHPDLYKFSENWTNIDLRIYSKLIIFTLSVDDSEICNSIFSFLIVKTLSRSDFVRSLANNNHQDLIWSSGWVSQHIIIHVGPHKNSAFK